MNENGDAAASEPNVPEASSSSTLHPLCQTCNHQYAVYTCPRCTARTCSLSCSKQHKENTGCTGERNKVAYVPMNQYRWGAMMDDYVYLEEIGRKVGDWGKEIVTGGYGSGTGGGEGGRGKGRGRGRGRGGGRGGGGGAGKTKRDIFKMQMEIRDIEVDLLPVGMNRRKANQSSWDFKNQTGLLTIEFKFHRPRNPLAPSSQADEPPLISLTHRNRMDKSLLSTIQTIIKERAAASKKESACPQWLRSLVTPTSEDPEGFIPPQCVILAQIDPLVARSSSMKLKNAFHGLDINRPLAVALRNIHFVEFPTIEVWEEFKGTIVDPQGLVTQTEERQVKRRKLNTKVGRAMMKGLLGGYGSDEEGGEEKDAQNVLSMLGEYAGSDEDDSGGHGEEIREDQKHEGDDGSSLGVSLDPVSDEEDGAEEMDPSALLELVKRLQGERWAEPGTGDDEALDWEGSDGEEAE